MLRSGREAGSARWGPLTDRLSPDCTSLWAVSVTSLEDLLEFLIVEGLVEPREGWLAAIEELRKDWFKKQLGAAFKADPVAAKAAWDEWRSENPEIQGKP
jgi:hypothetical protein